MASLIRMLCASGIMLLTGFYGCRTTETAMTNEQQNTNPPVENDPSSSEVATFAGGCFWGTEYVFQQIPGVLSTEVGFMGGRIDNPSYKQVCNTDTNHAEVVQITYDAEKISYEKLVKIFFRLHDPTTLNRQGPDVGTQYRSAIFYHDPSQQKIAEQIKSELRALGAFNNSIVTEIAPAEAFWKAEDYHQDYFKKKSQHPACHKVDFTEINNILNED